MVRLLWDEGPVVGDPTKWVGPHGPYRQMQRMESHYMPAIQSLLAEGKAYRCRCTKEELDGRRTAAEKAGKIFQYDRAAAADFDDSQPASIA